jgi:glycosyltransferase involved in cell wall biosynthesis
MSSVKNKKKIAFVIQRYGNEVNGGAEDFCKEIAEHLKDAFDIEVLTTCAVDCYTWKNEYPEGEDSVNSVKVRRFKVDFERDMEKFVQVDDLMLSRPGDIEMGLEWMRMQGPYSSRLFDYLKQNEKQYDRIIYFTYLYASTFFGILEAHKKSILVPFAHDEPPIYRRIFRRIFMLPSAISFSAPEERDLVHSVFSNRHIKHDVIGKGIDIPMGLEVDKIKKKYDVDNYIIFSGRVDKAKGCDKLIEYFLEYKKKFSSDLQFVLTGKVTMDLPKHKDIIPVGFVSVEDKINLIAGALALVNNSKYESFSIVLLESLASKRPVLVNAKSLVMKGHVDRSGGGFVYEGKEEFLALLRILETDTEKAKLLGENGYKYISENYDWEVVERKWASLLTNLKK